MLCSTYSFELCGSCIEIFLFQMTAKTMVWCTSELFKKKCSKTQVKGKNGSATFWMLDKDHNHNMTMAFLWYILAMIRELNLEKWQKEHFKASCCVCIHVHFDALYLANNITFFKKHVYSIRASFRKLVTAFLACKSYSRIVHTILGHKCSKSGKSLPKHLKATVSIILIL